MSEEPLNRLIQRLDHLERKVRWWKILGSGAAALLALGFLVGATSPDIARERAVVSTGDLVANEIAARRFIVVDTYGRNRLTVGELIDGSLGLYVWGEKGNPRLWLATWDDGVSRLSLHDQGGRARALLTVQADGSPSLSLRDESTKSRAVLGQATLRTARTGTMERRPAASLVLFDRDANVIWKAP